ncbi:MAG: hypothetical protein KC420_09670, partial [Myxococcales bacterium]|nr:hypothetical protein [Myxococcales bacterium]
LDLALAWRRDAHAQAPTEARARALDDAQRELGVDPSPTTITPLDPSLAGAIERAAAVHAWEEVLALSDAALAKGPHPELLFWAADARWQRGEVIEARRLWSRARALWRAGGVASSRPGREGVRLDIQQVAWSPAGLAIVDEHTHNVEVWADAAAGRPWRRWHLPTAIRGIAWVDAWLAVALEREVQVFDPRSGGLVTTMKVKVDALAGAERAPILALRDAWANMVGVYRLRLGDAPALDLIHEALLGEDGLLPRVDGVDDVRLVLDPTGASLAILHEIEDIEHVDLTRGRRRYLALEHRGPILSARLDGMILRYGDWSGLWEMSLEGGDPRKLPLIDAGGHTVEMQPLAIAANGASAGRHGDRQALMICGPSGAPCRVLATGATEAERLAFAPDGASVAAVLHPREGGLRRSKKVAGFDTFTPGPLVLVAAETATELWELRPQRFERGTLRTMPRVADLTPDGTILAIDGGEGVALWDPRSGEARLRREGLALRALTADGRYAVLGPPERLRREGPIEIHDLERGVMHESHGLLVAEPAFSLDGLHLALPCADHVQIIDLASGAEVARIALLHPPLALRWAAADRLLWTTSGGDLYTQDTRGAAPARVLHADDTVIDLASDGRTVGIRRRGEIEILDLPSGRRRRLAGEVRLVDAQIALHWDEVGQARLIPIRGGRRSAPFEAERHRAPRLGEHALIGRGLADLSIIARDGRPLATILATRDLGWIAVAAEGRAIDGVPAAMPELDVIVPSGGKEELYPAILAWDRDRVPGLVGRALAGELVRVPE